MEPKDWPLDPLYTAALVVRAIEDLDTSGEEERDELLCELLRAAWGSVWAQNQ
jgi:hypothetical protein